MGEEQTSPQKSMRSLASELFDALDLLWADGLTSKGLDELILAGKGEESTGMMAF